MTCSAPAFALVALALPPSAYAQSNTVRPPNGPVAGEFLGAKAADELTHHKDVAPATPLDTSALPFDCLGRVSFGPKAGTWVLIAPDDTGTGGFYLFTTAEPAERSTSGRPSMGGSPRSMTSPATSARAR